MEFDAAKRAATHQAKGLDMARAGEVFAGATLTVEDDGGTMARTASSPSGSSTAPWWFWSGRCVRARSGSSA